MNSRYRIRPYSLIWWLRGFGIVLLLVALVAAAPGTSYAQELPHLSADPAEPCNLTADQYDALLTGTELEGIGHTLTAGEKMYKVNGLFVAAIAAHESGWGSSRLAPKCNNLGGIKGGSGYRDFATREICVLYMFSLLDRLYISRGHDTIGEIGRVYCETGGWAGSIEKIMNKFILEAGETRD
jgi:hypothetical protein